jgi:hypothetical protein
MPYRPTHRAPDDGMQAWDTPDGTKPPVAALDARLDVEVVERQGAWARILCSNGWSAWVDGRRLVEMSAAAAAPTPAPTPAPAPTPTPTPAAPAPEPTPAPAPAAPAPAPTPAPAAAWSSPPASSPPAPTAPTPAAPAGAWTAPAGATPAPPRTSDFGVGSILALAGAAVVLISGWLKWFSFDEEGFELEFTSYQIPMKFLADSDVGPLEAGLPIGALLVLLAAVCVVGALVPAVRLLSIVGGGLAVVVALLFVFQLDRADTDPYGLSDFLTIAPFVAVVGGGLGIAGGVLGLQGLRKVS